LRGLLLGPMHQESAWSGAVGGNSGDERSDINILTS
jgi:hypothetical protein